MWEKHDFYFLLINIEMVANWQLFYLTLYYYYYIVKPVLSGLAKNGGPTRHDDSHDRFAMNPS